MLDLQKLESDLDSVLENETIESIQRWMINKRIRYNIFGSENSLDTDIMVKVETMPSISESKKLTEEYVKVFNTFYKDPNINFCVIENGGVVDVYKGTNDEVNNSIYATYSLHNNEQSCLVDRKLDRDILLKAFRVMRVLLTFFSRTEYRAEVKEQLKNGNLESQIDFLLTLNLVLFDKIHPKYDNVDIYKTYVFQLLQLYHLLNGKECYTKTDLAYCVPKSYSDVLQRKEVPTWVIAKIFNDLLKEIKVKLEDKEDYHKVKSLSEIIYNDLMSKN